MFLMKKLKKYFHLLTLPALMLLLSCEQKVYTGETIQPAESNGKIVLRTDLPGAEIYLNGKNMGIKTPDSLVWLQPGSYSITLKLKLFKDVKLNGTLVLGDKINLYYSYYNDPSNFGAIKCFSTPASANIIFNDSATGLKTPATLSNLFPGDYKIKVTYPACRPDSATVTVQGGYTQIISFALEDTTQWINYKVTNSPITSNYISCVAVDKNNVKWIGTLDKGLLKFDGKKWTIFQKANSPIVYDFISCLAVDRNNNLWVGMPGGLMVYNGTTWIDYTANLPAIFVSSITFDNSGNTWIGTQNGLVKYNGSSWKVYQTSNSGLSGNFILSVAADSKGKIWIGTNSFGISVFDGTNWKVYNMANMSLTQNVGNAINDIAVDNIGNVWVAHVANIPAGESGGTTMFDGTKWNLITLNGIPTTLVEKIWVDQNNYKWICSKGGLGKFMQVGDLTTFTTTNSKLPANQVKDVVIDSNGDLWIGTFGGGLAKLKKGNF